MQWMPSQSESGGSDEPSTSRTAVDLDRARVVLGSACHLSDPAGRGGYLDGAPALVGRSGSAGLWNSQTSTPLQRPREGPLAGRDTLTLEEAETLEATNRANFDLPPREGSVGNYNAFWRDVGKALTRTSLIIDPPDGRMPLLSPEGQARIDAERAERVMRRGIC